MGHTPPLNRPTAPHALVCHFEEGEGPLDIVSAIDKRAEGPMYTTDEGRCLGAQRPSGGVPCTAPPIESERSRDPPLKPPPPHPRGSIRPQGNSRRLRQRGILSGKWSFKSSSEVLD